MMTYATLLSRLPRWAGILAICWIIADPLPIQAQNSVPQAACRFIHVHANDTWHNKRKCIVPVFETTFWNVKLFRVINRHHSDAVDIFFSKYGRFAGNAWIMLPAFLLTIWLRRYKVKALLIAFAIESIIVGLLKEFLNQPRPPLLLDNVHLLYPHSWGSCPSGDSAVTFAIAFTLLRGERWPVRFLLFLYALFVAYERVYIGVHFPLDVTVGALIGIGSAALAWRWVERRKPLPTVITPVIVE